MELKNPLYKNIGVHVVSSIFTVDRGVVKVLLIKRTNEPYKDFWALPGGAMYNNELIMDAAKRELNEKTGISDVNLSMCKVIDTIDRSPIRRMIAICFIGVLDIKKVELLKSTSKTSESGWVDINYVNNLAYDHDEVLKFAIEELKNKIITTDILKSLFPDEFTLPELHNVYNSILGIDIDRRNFRKKMLNLNLISDTNKTVVYKGKKPAKLYRFNDIENNKDRKSVV